MTDDSLAGPPILNDASLTCTGQQVDAATRRLLELDDLGYSTPRVEAERRALVRLLKHGEVTAQVVADRLAEIYGLNLIPRPAQEERRCMAAALVDKKFVWENLTTLMAGGEPRPYPPSKRRGSAVTPEDDAVAEAILVIVAYYLDLLRWRYGMPDTKLLNGFVPELRAALQGR